MIITLQNMAMISFLFRNDLHFLHHNIRGRDFIDMHEKFGEYYDKALEDADFFAERTIIKEADVFPNFSQIHDTDVFKMWKPIMNQAEFHIDKAIEIFIKNGTEYLEALELCRDYCEKEGWDDIISDIDSIHGYWSVEIEYKAERIS
jgi:DNA-binding ferritin-like protein